MIKLRPKCLSHLSKRSALVYVLSIKARKVELSTLVSCVFRFGKALLNVRPDRVKRTRLDMVVKHLVHADGLSTRICFAVSGLRVQAGLAP